MFNAVDTEGNVKHKFEATMNWCHGKFYNMDNLWKPQGIHFIRDLKSHEDIAICTQVTCALQALGVNQYTYFQFPVYAWTDNPQSVSHAKYTIDVASGEREFLEVFFDDYVHSTGYLYLEGFNLHKLKMVNAIKLCVEIICYCYFYTQGFQFRRPDSFYLENFKIAGKYVNTCKKTFNLTNDSIYSLVASGNAAMYYNIKKLADPGSGHYIPQQTFQQWLELVCKSVTT